MQYNRNKRENEVLRVCRFTYRIVQLDKNWRTFFIFFDEGVQYLLLLVTFANYDVERFSTLKIDFNETRSIC